MLKILVSQSVGAPIWNWPLAWWLRFLPKNVDEGKIVPYDGTAIFSRLISKRPKTEHFFFKEYCFFVCTWTYLALPFYEDKKMHKGSIHLKLSLHLYWARRGVFEMHKIQRNHSTGIKMSKIKFFLTRLAM